jgi:hypothetical protein
VRLEPFLRLNRLRGRRPLKRRENSFRARCRRLRASYTLPSHFARTPFFIKKDERVDETKKKKNSSIHTKKRLISATGCGNINPLPFRPGEKNLSIELLLTLACSRAESEDSTRNKPRPKPDRFFFSSSWAKDRLTRGQRLFPRNPSSHFGARGSRSSIRYYHQDLREKAASIGPTPQSLRLAPPPFLLVEKCIFR